MKTPCFQDSNTSKFYNNTRNRSVKTFANFIVSLLIAIKVFLYTLKRLKAYSGPKIFH